MKYGIGIDISIRKIIRAILSVAWRVIEEPFKINYDIDWLNLLKKN